MLHAPVTATTAKIIVELSANYSASDAFLIDFDDVTL